MQKQIKKVSGTFLIYKFKKNSYYFFMFKKQIHNFLFILTSGILSIYLGKDCNWDLKNYHIYNPYSFLKKRLLFDIAPAQLQTYFNPILDIPFYLMMVKIPPKLFGFIVGAIQGINLILIYNISYLLLDKYEEKKRKILSILSAITGFLGVANLYEIGTSYHDNIVSIFILLAIYLTLKKRKSSFLPGLILGLGIGLKLNMGIYAIPFLVSITFFEKDFNKKIKSFFITGSGILSGILITSGYWMYILLINFKNPLFPYFNEIFKSPYYDITNIPHSGFFPKNLLQKLFYPLYFMKKQKLVNETPFRDLRLGICYILFIISVIKITIRGEWKIRKEEIFFLTFFPLSYIIWQQMFSVYRYTIPLELLSSVFILIAIGKIIRDNSKVFFSSVFLFTLLIFTIYPMNSPRCKWDKKYLSVNLPEIIKSKKRGIILTTWEPTSYVIPFFPENYRFICTKNNFLSPKSKSLLEKKVKEILKNTKAKEIYLITLESDLNKRYDSLRLFFESFLNPYNLTLSNEEPLKIKTTFETLFLYRVLKKTNSFRGKPM